MNLRRIIDLLERHLPLTAGDKRVLDTELLQLEGTVKDVGSTIGPGGRVTQMVSGNVSIRQEYGLWIINPDGGATTVALEPDGDVRIGSDVNDVTRTGFNVFSHDQRYNGENLGEGDILFGDNSTSKANMIWDRSVGQLRFRSGQANKITIGTDGNFIIANQLRSSNYAAGAAGFLIDGPTGDAEFNNITARGSIITSVFVKNLIEAKAGSLMVAYSAGMLHTDMTVPISGTWVMVIADPPGGGFLFQNGDVCKVKEVFVTSVIELFFTVSGRVDNANGTQSYTCTYGSGDRSVQRVYKAGLPVVDMGQSGQGYLYMTADDAAAPFYSVRSWVTNPWTAGNITERARLGNMNGAFGTGANNRYGFGVGDYTGGNYMSYNAETVGGFILKAGGGSVAIDTSGIQIENGLTSRLMFTSSIGEKGAGKGVNFIAYVKDFIIHNYEVGGYLRSAINMTDGSTSYTRLWEISPNAMRFDISVATAGSSFCVGGVVLDSGGDIRAEGGIIAGSIGIDPAVGTINTDHVDTLTENLADAYAGAFGSQPGYTGAYTITRHNFINLVNPSLAGSAVLTDACVFRFNAAAGTHKAVDSGTTKTTPGTVDAWMKININGTIYYIPAYTSKAS
jgi:hypothetical protein